MITQSFPEVSAPPVLAGNANSKRQCYFLIVSQFFLLPEPPAPPTCPSSRIAVLAKRSNITSPPIPIHLTISLSTPALSSHIWCTLVRVFMCREMMQYPVSDLPFLPAQPKAEIFCVYACRMLSHSLSHFHCRCSLLFHTHTHTLKTKVTSRIRLPCSALEGQKAPDRFTVSVVCCWSSMSLVLLVLQLQKLVDFTEF